MAGRFDPVRDSVISPTQKYAVLSSEEAEPVISSNSPHAVHQEEEALYRQRRPSRSASIAEILNNDYEPRASSSHIHDHGDSRRGSISNGGGYKLNRYGSSPSSSNVMLPHSSSPLHSSPRSRVSEISEMNNFQPDVATYSPENGVHGHLHRTSSSLSASSSIDYHPPNHHQFSQVQPHKVRRSPSVLSLLNSEIPRGIEEGHRSYTNEVPPRGRGPSFAGGMAILSPTNEESPKGRLTNGSHLRHQHMNQHMNQSPLQQHSAVEDHTRVDSSMTGQSYFAIPQVPYRSPDTIRNRTLVSHLTSSPDTGHPTIPSHHLRMNDYDPVKHEASNGKSRRDMEAGATTSSSPPPSLPPPANDPAPSPSPPLLLEAPKEPYRPVTRVSVPTTIRLPVTAKQVDEMQFQCRNSLRTKWERANPDKDNGWKFLISRFTSQIKISVDAKVVSKESPLEKKRKRAAEQDVENNAMLVAEHYNSRQDQGLGARQQSPILPLRNFNNWIKSVIIGTFAKRQGRVLDLGGGKGGDLQKWDKAKIGEYILCDIAAVSVEQAESRYYERRYNFQARFFSLDCFAYPLADNIPLSVLEPLFDNVTLQFCLHYGWESVPKAQLMLENIARFLKPGGVFVGTMPNADLLRSKLTIAMKSTPPKTSFGNQYYTVEFDPTDTKNTTLPPFGHKYKFSLLDAVDDVAEYVVDWDQFISLAEQNGLRCIYKKTFEQVYRQEGQDGRFRDLTRRMKIVPSGPNGLPMNAELWEATGE